MRSSFFPLLLLLALVGTIFWPATSQADAEAELEASQQRLVEIQQQIEEGLHKLRAQQARAGSLTDDLGRLDVEVRRLTAAAQRSQEELKRLDADLRTVQKELEALQATRRDTEKLVRKRLTVLYKNGEVGLAKVLLGATTTPYAVAENHFYLTRMVRHDRQLVDAYRAQAASLEDKLAELERLRTKQARTSERRKREQAVLAKASQGKRRLLEQIRKDEALQASYLKELRAKAARLADLVEKLETGLVQTYTAPGAPFLEQKGRLAWPVDGALRTGFGKIRNSELGTMFESHGFEIAAVVGSPVRAVWGGKVLFASPFRGYGKLMILDHGEKYYSLYAHVARFEKQAGEQVAAGDLIAYSGFEGRDALYFEIRRSGQPLDPKPWLKPR